MTSDNVALLSDHRAEHRQFVDMDGDPVDPATWAAYWTEHSIHVLRTSRVGTYVVVTEWLGISDPVIDIHPFMTHLFELSDPVLGWPCHSWYQTRQAALTGHDDLVRQLTQPDPRKVTNA